MRKNKRVIAIVLVFSLILGGMTWINFTESIAANKLEQLGIAQYLDHYYMRIEGNVDWEEAKSGCEEIGGHLVQIENEEEQEFITELIQGAGDFYWLGGYYDGSTWKWLDGSEIQYFNWIPGQPDNEYSEEWMLEISSKNQFVNNWKVTKGGWNDVVGGATRGYICEWDSYSDIKVTTTTDAIFTQENINSKISKLPDCRNVVKSDAVIPGLIRTNQSENAVLDCCDKMVPQGLCYTKQYILISAYCHHGGNIKHSSVIYVLDKNSKKYMTTIRLKDVTAHVGAMTYDGESVVYISGQKQLLKLSLQKIHEAITSGQDVWNATGMKKNAISIEDTPSFLCFRGKGANGKIYVGTFGESAFLNNSMQAYSTNGQKINGDKVILPPQAQGAVICSYGGRDYVISSCSYGRNNKSKIYVQLLERAQGINGLIMLSSYQNAAVFDYPNMTEDIELQSGRLYINLESASTVYNTGKEGNMPIDRILYNSIGSLIERANKKIFSSFSIRDAEENSIEVLNEGECGDDTTYTLYNNGKLVIEGKGDMTDYEEHSAPWYPYSAQIQEVTVGGDVTSIGTHAFDSCVNLMRVYISQTDSGQSFTLKMNSLSECAALKEINLPDRTYEIEDNVFPQSENLIIKSDAETVKKYCETQNNSALSLHTHTYVKTETIGKTCAAFGYDVYECSCGDKIYKNITEDTQAHQFEEVGRVEATEEENGQELFRCSTCGTEYVKELSYDPNGQATESPVPTSLPQPTAVPTQQPAPITSAVPERQPNLNTNIVPTQQQNDNSKKSKQTTKAKRPMKIKGIKVKKLRANKNGALVKISWKKNAKVSLSQIQCATNASFAKSKKKVVLGSRNSILYSLKRKKTYYFRIRCKEGVYSKWSKTFKIVVS